MYVGYIQEETRRIDIEINYSYYVYNIRIQDSICKLVVSMCVLYSFRQIISDLISIALKRDVHVQKFKNV